jgi:hypothetical protein
VTPSVRAFVGSDAVIIGLVTFLTVSTRIILASTFPDVSELKTKNDACYSANDRRECLFMSADWRASEMAQGQLFCTSHDGRLVSIKSMQV